MNNSDWNTHTCDCGLHPASLYIVIKKNTSTQSNTISSSSSLYSVSSLEEMLYWNIKHTIDLPAQDKALTDQTGGMTADSTGILPWTVWDVKWGITS